MASSSELSLDCKPQSYSMLLKSFGESDQTTQKLEDLLSRLEQERLKIDAFKRELPLCMQLLSNAVEVYKQQLEAYRANSNNSNQSVVARPVLEEFIPIRNQPEKESNKGNNWMTTAQLWSQPETIPKNIDPTTDQSPKDELASSPKLGHFDAKQRNGGGAFLPFSKEKSLPELALSTEVRRVSPANEHTNGHDGNDESMIHSGTNNNNNNNNSNGNGVSSTTSQSNRKARRCWSPDLHRRFVQALQMLGGSQVATPKQIRELMKVDGLTNDEVKSHLQKYRLHTRRSSPSPQTSGGQGPHLVVLGGIWVPPEYTAHGGTPTLYHHQGNATAQPPPHFCSSQEFYTARPPPQPLHQHHHFQTCNGSSGGGSASTESAQHQLTDSAADEGKSPESGGGERRGLAALREESGGQNNVNGSEITLTF
ncbi:hypothetical protein Bca4012_059886 [Brassica carinata]|uniref:HTH myb-type domain-containing protein n=1 Tax=Brassica carinata TaxID=52824 RepID=A0A8X7SCX6_BRACI|nr:hypothetical protein Bca52824_030295 [Brassica carinata]